MFQTKVVGKTKTRILHSVIFFQKPYSLQDNVEIYCTVGEPTYENMAHAHCVLDT